MKRSWLLVHAGCEVNQYMSAAAAAAVVIIAHARAIECQQPSTLEQRNCSVISNNNGVSSTRLH